MATITFIVDSVVPPGWQLEHLVRLGDRDWQVQLSSGGTPPLVLATGEYPEEALRAAVEKIERRDYFKVLAEPRTTVQPRGPKVRPTLSDL